MFFYRASNNSLTEFFRLLVSSSTARRHLANLEERAEYTHQLEARIQALENQRAPANSPPTAHADLVSDDLVIHLSRMTLGSRARSIKHSPLETHFETLFAGVSSQRVPAVFLSDNPFKMSLIPTGLPTPLDQLRANLPPALELAQLARFYFDGLNIWFPSVNSDAWADALIPCYSPEDPHQLKPEDFHKIAAVFVVAGHGLLTMYQPGASPPVIPPPAQVARAHRWYHLALRTLTQPDQGAMLTQPTVWGVRAMSLLAIVPLS